MAQPPANAGSAERLNHEDLTDCSNSRRTEIGWQRADASSDEPENFAIPFGNNDIVSAVAYHARSGADNRPVVVNRSQAEIRSRKLTRVCAQSPDLRFAPLMDNATVQGAMVWSRLWIGKRT